MRNLGGGVLSAYRMVPMFCRQKFWKFWDLNGGELFTGIASSFGSKLHQRRLRTNT